MKDLGIPKYKSRLFLVILGIVVVSLVTTYLNWVKYVSLRSTWAFDLAFFHNIAFNFAQGRSVSYILLWSAFDPMDFNGPSVFRSSHFSPLFYLVVQIYRWWPQIEGLMFIQSVIIALGALPLFWFAVDRTKHASLGLLLAYVYLLHPAILHLGFNDYRNIALGMTPGLFALWFHSRRNFAAFIISSLLMLSARNEYTFLLPFFGLMNWRSFQHRKNFKWWLISPVLLAGFWAIVCNIYYLYAFDRTWPALPVSVGGESLFSFIFEWLRRIPIFFRIGLLPVFVGLLSVETLIGAIPFLVFAGSVHWPSFPHHDLQHLCPAFVALFWAFANGTVRMWLTRLQVKKHRVTMMAIISIITLVSFIHFSWGTLHTYRIRNYPRYSEITKINNSLPIDATIMAPKKLLARFSNHTRVLANGSLPYGPDELPNAKEFKTLMVNLASVCDLVVTDKGEEWIDQIVFDSGRFEPPRFIQHYRFYLAKLVSSKPSNPDESLQRILRWDEMSKTKRRWLE